MYIVQYACVLRYLKVNSFFNLKIQIWKRIHLGFLGSFVMLFLVLQANYVEKVKLVCNFFLVNTNAPGLLVLRILETES